MGDVTKMWLGVLSTVGLALAASVQTSTAGEVVDDSMLTAKVKAALIDDPAVKSRKIDVESNDGTVQLNGFVESSSEKAAAEVSARNVAGVSRVTNNLQVRPGERSVGAVLEDGVLTAKVKSALIADSRTKAHQIEVKANKGVISLGGFVTTPVEKQAAESVASNVEGVASVENGIQLGKH